MKKGELNVKVEPRADRAAHVEVEGSVDGHTFDKFRKAMTELADGGTLFLVVDLSEMAYIASVGINFLVNLRVQRRKSGGESILVAPQPQVLKIFKMLGLLEVLVVTATPEEAWSEIRSRLHPSPSGGDGSVPLIE
jgi:anti-sigma B factor antagonist